MALSAPGLQAPLVTDSITSLGPDARGRAVLAASHGGSFPAYLAAKAGVKAVIFSDAGIGRERAGIGGLVDLDRLHVPAAAVSHRSARIGDGVDCARRGVISVVNVAAAAHGLHAGMSARVALEILAATELPPSPAPAALHETRHRLTEVEAPGVPVFALDSASTVGPQDQGAIVLTGSHGALLGGRPETAIKCQVYAAVFSDADRGADDAGLSRLPALQARNIAAATVSVWSARIGDGLSVYRDGFVTALNERAMQMGGAVGLAAGEFVRVLVMTRRKELGG